MSELDVTTLTNQDIQLCKAWCSFVGTGTPAINDDYNISSITDNGAGDYTFGFTVNMTDTNYCVSGSATDDTVTSENVVAGFNYLVGSVDITSVSNANIATDRLINNFIIFGN